MLVNLNAVLSIIANVPAAVASTVRSRFTALAPAADTSSFLDCRLPCCAAVDELYNRGC